VVTLERAPGRAVAARRSHLGSANGVYVNHACIVAPHQLSDGDRIVLGKFALSSHERRSTPSPEVYWFDYAVDLHYQAKPPMRAEVVASLAGAAVVVPELDRALPGRYATWLRASPEPATEQQAAALRFFEALGWGRLEPRMRPGPGAQHDSLQ
jgi:hypothetical protein